MKKLFTLKTMLLTLLCVMGVSSAWGATEKSYTISFKDNGGTSDGSTTWSKNSTLSSVFTSSDYVSAITALADVYPARTGRGAKFGTSKKAGSITFSLTKAGQVTAKRIEITGGAYVSGDPAAAEVAKVKVNGGEAIQFDQTVTSYTEETITYSYTTPTDITSISLVQNNKSAGRFYVKSITVYYDEEDSSLETATWSLTPSSANVDKNASTELALTTNYDGTLSFTSNKTDVATVSYNAETKKITVNGVAAGSTTISVTGAATSKYKAISKTIDVTVNQPELQYNKTVTSNDWGYEFFGLTPSGSDTYVQPDVATTEKNIDILNVAIKRNGSSCSKPRYDANCLRFYKGNSIVITAPQGYNITSVTFTEPASGKSWAGTMTVTTGVYDNTAKKWFAEANDINSIEITGKDDTNRIGGIIVNLYGNSTSYTLTIGECGYATFYDSEHKYIVPEGMTTYSFGQNNETQKYGLQEEYSAGGDRSVVPEGVAQVLKAAPGTYTLQFTAESAWMPGNNMLKGTDTEATTTADLPGAKFYALSLNAAGETSSVGFYWMAENGAAFTNGAHKAYLTIDEGMYEVITGGAPKMCFLFNDDDATAITNAKVSKSNDAVIYNLAGQRVTSIGYKGIIIKNGKKFVNK